jgi:hypothetical protein
MTPLLMCKTFHQSETSGSIALPGSWPPNPWRCGVVHTRRFKTRSHNLADRDGGAGAMRSGTKFSDDEGEGASWGCHYDIVLCVIVMGEICDGMRRWIWRGRRKEHLNDSIKLHGLQFSRSQIPNPRLHSTCQTLKQHMTRRHPHDPPLLRTAPLI